MPKIFSDIEKDIQRNTLFEKGLQMIVERGYKNVTVDELVTLIGSSKGYFYRLFESKEEFFPRSTSRFSSVAVAFTLSFPIRT